MEPGQALQSKVGRLNLKLERVAFQRNNESSRRAVDV